MPNTLQKIDPRDQQKLVKQARELVLQYCPEWGKDTASLETDKQADALIQIFCRMMGIILQRLNRVPDKNFLTFLDLIGVRLLPPRTARAALTFTMAKGASQYGSIPAGTQVAAEIKDKEPLVFETEKELTVILPKLVRVISLSPDQDRWTDHTPVLIDKKKEAIEALFYGMTQIPHRIYLGHKTLFGFKESTTIILNLKLKNRISMENVPWEVKWYCYKKEDSPDLIPLAADDNDAAKLLDNGDITFRGIGGISIKTLAGYEKETGQQETWTNNWIFAELKTPIPKNNLPEIDTIKVKVEIKPITSTGTGTISSKGLDITGDGTAFVRELKKDDTVTAAGQTKIVTAIVSDTSLTVDSAFDPELPAGTSFSYTSFGTGTISSEGTTVTGDERTAFKTELKIGDSITAAGQTKIVTAIISDTSLTVDSAFEPDLGIGTHFTYASSPPPDFAFFNNFPLDLTRDFYPFGEKPRFNDAFYIGSEKVFSKVGATITISIVLSPGLQTPNPENIRLTWEFWDGKNWMEIGKTDKSGVVDEGSYSFTDTANAFTCNGQVKFTCPKIEARKIFGEDTENYWIRVRIIDGNYGEEAKYESVVVYQGTGTISSDGATVTGDDRTAFNKELAVCDSITAGGQTRSVTNITSDHNLTVKSAFKPDLPQGTKFTYSSDKPAGTDGAQNTLWVYKPPTFIPPSINTSTLVYDFAPSEGNLEVVLTCNDFTYQDQTEACRNENQYFIPFQPVADEVPALYLAFDHDQSIEANLPVTIFFPLLEKIFASYQGTKDQGIQEKASLVWEYWTGEKWNELKVEDNTTNLTEREMILFNVPADMTKRPLFEAEYYWIRARLDKGKYEGFPRLKAIYTNTAWAYNKVTVQDEILGSSNGKPGQVFKLSRPQVLPGEKVLVKENSLTEEERSTVTIDEEIKDDAGNIIGFWVLWVEKKHFYSSDPNSRHYVIDRNNGEITFGDGEMGMIPTAGENNIKCSYKSGGGIDGNVPAGTIIKLRKSFPYIDSVTNPEAADGGGNQEDIERISERGPQTLKHRDRAVTYEDFEMLIKDASPKVARVKCLPTSDPSLQFSPGWVTIIIVPETDNSKPLPSQELISVIKENLKGKTSSFLMDLSQINMIGPGYIQVGVEASVKFTSIAGAKTIEGKIINNLTEFFHPLRGGPENKGWDFGRDVYISEVYEVIENTEGVDYVEGLSFNASIQIYKFTLMKYIKTSVSYPENSIVISVDRDIVFSLAEGLPQGVNINTLTAVGFKEGDLVSLSHNGNSERFVLKSVSSDRFGDIIECEPFSTVYEYPVGSIVETSDNRVRSFILNEVPENSEISLLKIAILEAGDKILLSLIDDPSKTESAEIESLSDKVETIFIEKNYLVYSGTHAINRSGREELVFPYLFNVKSKEIHNLNNEQPNCHLADILKKHRKFTRTLDKIDGYDYCRWCFGAELSKR